MIIQSLKIEGFKSFTNEQEFIFQQYKDGLYLISGYNESNGKLSSNGVGKTSIFDSLCWCLYGTTSNKLKSNNLISWTCNSIRVELTFIQHDKYYKLVRFYPNKIILNDKQIVQSEITDLVGMDLQTFLYSVLIPYDTDTFFDLRSEDKLFLLEDVLNLNIWIKCSELARERVKQKQWEIDNIENMFRNNYGALEILQANVEQNAERERVWKSETSKRIEDLKIQIVDINKQIEDQQLIIEQQGNVLKHLKIKRNEYSENINNMILSHDKLLNKLTAVTKESFLARGIFNSIEQERQSFSKVKTICDICKQTVDEKHRQEQCDIFKKRQTLAREKLEKSDYEVKLINQEKEASQGKIDKANYAYSENEKQIKNIEKLITDHANKIKLSEYNKKKSHDNIIKLKNEKGIYRELIDADNAKIVKIKKSESINRKKVVKLKEDQANNYYWVKGFKDIRLLVIETVLIELEIFSNNYLVKLGMDGWKIKYYLNRKTKNGIINKGFSLYIKSPNNESPVPFKVWSGGEKQRLRLAGTLALMDLLGRYSGSDFNIEIYDESTQHLSPEGISDLLELLRSRAIEQHKTLFLIDQRNFKDLGIFDGVINIVKTNKGSLIENTKKTNKY